jgi:hypothetical protein
MSFIRSELVIMPTRDDAGVLKTTQWRKMALLGAIGGYWTLLGTIKVVQQLYVVDHATNGYRLLVTDYWLLIYNLATSRLSSTFKIIK